MSRDQTPLLTSLGAALDGIGPVNVFGRVAAVKGLLVEISGPIGAMSLGGRLDIEISAGAMVIFLLRNCFYF
jgi:flagellum-specific ATP synthase